MPWSKIDANKNELDFFRTEGNVTENRVLTYGESIREALKQSMEIDSRVYVMGQGVDDPSGMFGATTDLHKEFGEERSFDTPLAETGLTGVAVGSAIAGMRPVYFHNRPDFLFLAMDQIVNHASKWSYMFGGAVNVPLVLWACIGRGWGSAAQHSQALQAMFFHIPGLKLVMPSSCYDAKGFLMSAIKDNNPVLILDHRFNFKNKGNVPEHAYTIPIGKGIVRRKGADVTVVAISHLVTDVCEVAQELEKEGIDVEVIDPRTLRPLDEDLILQSVKKTGKLVVVDNGWKTGGVTGEISALVLEKCFEFIKAPVARVTCPDAPTPAGYTLEDAFYITAEEIKSAIIKTVKYSKVK